MFKEREEPSVRYDKKIQTILHYYHYNKRVRIAGEEVIDIRIRHNIIPVVRSMQDAMINQMSQRGVYVECNPSSNYLIGPLKYYKDHPIFRFNNYRMGNGVENNICVSINTDDMGVFDTSLDNEYCLIAAAMEDIVDRNGRRRYSDDFVHEYLEHVRIMGHRQTFEPLETND